MSRVHPPITDVDARRARARRAALALAAVALLVYLGFIVGSVVTP